MTQFVGCIMIILACSLAGWQGKASLSKHAAAIREAEQITRQLRIGLCTQRLTLPGVLPMLEKSFPERFSGAVEAYDFVSDMSFGEFWLACLRRGRYPGDVIDILTECVGAISQGIQPERALDVCEAKLQQKGQEAAARERDKGRLRLACGVGGGCMLALVLL